MNDPDMGTWAYAYDAVDNLTSQTDARGVAIAFTYDALNRLTNKSYAIPNGLTGVTGQPVTYTYDAAATPFSKGKLTAVADGSGAASFEYDNLGRLVKETKTVDGVAHVLQRASDLLGRLISLTYPDGAVASYTYNAHGGIEAISLQLSAVSQAIVSNIDYNAAGQVTKLVYGNGVVSDYTYHPQTLRLDRLVSTGPGGAVQDFQYSFDAVGNVSAIQDAIHTGTQSFTYDALHRLTQAQGAYGTATYGYDPLGNLTRKAGVTMTYPAAGAARPHAVTGLADGTALTYDANGNLKTKAKAGVTLATYTWDAENRLVQTQQVPAAKTVTLNLQTGWNFISLPVTPVDAHATRLFGAACPQVSRYNQPAQTWTHGVKNPEFDDFDTLTPGVGYEVYCTQATQVALNGAPVARASQSLPAGWHLLGMSGSTSLSVASWLAGVAVGQVRNAAGQSVPTVQPGQAYWVQVSAPSTWTAATPAAETTTYVYDGDGGRVKQTTAAGTTTYLGESYEKTDSATTKYVFAGSQRIAAKDSTGALRFYHGDHLGSSNVITDSTGQVIELAEYTPFGSVSRQEGTTNVAQKFTGQRLDSTGLYFYQSRYYDPSLGRFLSPDPFVQDPTDPQSLNRYTYVRNNPVNFVDPSGYGWKSFFKILAIVAIAVAVVATAGAALGAAPAVAAVIGESVSLGTIASTAGWVAAGSMLASSVLPGPGGGLSPAAATAITAGGITLASGGALAPAALLGAATLQAGIGYAGTRLLESPPAQEGIERAAGALESFGIAPWAALLLASVTAGTAVFGALSAGVSAAGAREEVARESTEVVQRAMSRAELQATRDSGLLRGGKVGTIEDPHFVSNAVHSNALRARQRLALPQTPEVRATLEVPAGRFSTPSEVEPIYGTHGGGRERSATGVVPARVLREDNMK